MSSLASRIATMRAALRDRDPHPLVGGVERSLGNLIEIRLDRLRIGELCRLHDPSGLVLDAEVVSVQGNLARLTPLGDAIGLSGNAVACRTGSVLSVAVSDEVLGRVLDRLGRPIDGGAILTGTAMSLDNTAPTSLGRRPIGKALAVGVRAIDALLTCAEGQRVGIFGPAGAGKSTLVSQIVQGVTADVVVVGLVGERGREVREFLDNALASGHRSRCVVVAATSDRPALERVKAAQTATAIAEWFRDRGRSVLLLIDSLTRVARAWREIGLAAGEPPARRGFPPSVFAALPRLLERTGPGEHGTITGIYTVLVEGDVEADPIAEDTKAILDGHIMLSPTLAAADRYPAIDILASRSRLMNAVVSTGHREAASRLRAMLQRLEDIDLLVRVGEYRAGEDTLADEALARRTEIENFLRQIETEPAPWHETQERLMRFAR
jgi:type III secretion protein N (ATPase)